MGNFVDQGFYDTQEEVNDLTWIFPDELAQKSMDYVAEQAPTAEAIVVNGMPNWRRAADSLPQRALAYTPNWEAKLGKPVVASDTALYWRIFKTLGIAPEDDHGRVHPRLRKPR